ncbi:MAG: fumarate hydratase [Nitrospirota bacterium]
MLKLRDGIVELYRKVATSVPPDVEEALRAAHDREAGGSEAKEALAGMLENIRRSRKSPQPVCIETGIPAFYLSVPKGLSHSEILDTIAEATRLATRKVPLSANAVDIVSERNTGDNTGKGFPIIHLGQSPSDMLTVELTLRCPDCETKGQTYSLPDESLGGATPLENIGRCALDSVRKAKGRGCPPYVVGVGAGASKDQVTALSRIQLMRKLPERAAEGPVADLEEKILAEINGLGIGPLGRGGSATALAVKVGLNHRMTSSFVVDVYLSCWALRRGRLIW